VSRTRDFWSQHSVDARSLDSKREQHYYKLVWLLCFFSPLIPGFQVFKVPTDWCHPWMDQMSIFRRKVYGMGWMDGWMDRYRIGRTKAHIRPHRRLQAGGQTSSDNADNFVVTATLERLPLLLRTSRKKQSKRQCNLASMWTRSRLYRYTLRFRFLPPASRFWPLY
jgi:hypothetical protein